MKKITILGSQGFIGSHLAKKLMNKDTSVYMPHRGTNLLGMDLGMVVYCIGMTSDFRKKPYDTVEAHVCYLKKILSENSIESIVYLSSTRLYGGLSDKATEDSNILIDSSDPDSLYNISKLMGESLLLSCHSNVKILRLSNVYGPDYLSDNYLISLVKSAIDNGKIVLNSGIDSERDYIAVGDVVELIIKIIISGRYEIYNLASGFNVSSRDIINNIKALTGCQVEIRQGVSTIRFPIIDNSRIKEEFGYEPSHLLGDIGSLVKGYIVYKDECHDKDRL